MEQEEFGCEIKSEVRFLNLFGYRVIGPDDYSRYLVVDEKGKEIGFIQKKKLHHKNAKKNLPAVFGYCTQIKSDKIRYQNVRRQDGTNHDTYEFMLQNPNMDQVCICLGKSLTIWSKEYGYINLTMKENMMSINFDRKTDKNHIEETIYIESSNRKKAYEYCISTCDKNKKMENAKDRTTYNTSFSHDSNQAENTISIHELHWEKNTITKDESAVVSGTIEEVIEKHQTGRNATQYFRNVVNQLLPFQNEVLTMLLEEIDLKKEFALLLFDGDVKPPYQKGKKIMS